MFESLLLAASLWTTPVGAADRLVPVEVPVAVGLDTWSANDEWSIPVFTASADDAKVAVLYSAQAWEQAAAGRWRRSGNRPEVEQEIRRSAKAEFPREMHVYSSTSTTRWELPARAAPHTPRQSSFHVPAQAAPAPGPDGHMAVLQPDGSVLETYGTVRLSSGDLVVLSYSVTRPASLGDGSQRGQTASMLPCYLGMLDDDEVASGRIRHALAATLPPRMLAPRAAYPAAAFDRDATTAATPYAGTVPMGARLFVDPALDLDTLRLRTAEGRVIGRALQRFGMVVVDRGGEGISLRVRRNPAKANPALHRWNAPLQQDLQRLFQHLVSPSVVKP